MTIKLIPCMTPCITWLFDVRGITKEIWPFDDVHNLDAIRAVYPQSKFNLLQAYGVCFKREGGSRATRWRLHMTASAAIKDLDAWARELAEGVDQGEGAYQ